MCKINLELMDFRFAELCSFDPVQETVECRLSVVDPFVISVCKEKEGILIEAKEDIEWISFDDEEVKCHISAGDYKLFKVKVVDSFKGSFKVLKDKNKRIFQHQWTL